MLSYDSKEENVFKKMKLTDFTVRKFSNLSHSLLPYFVFRL
jgi:hypothetical protein